MNVPDPRPLVSGKYPRNPMGDENWQQALREERVWTDGNRAGRKPTDHPTRPTDPKLARLYDLGVAAAQGRPRGSPGYGRQHSGGLDAPDLPELREVDHPEE